MKILKITAAALAALLLLALAYLLIQANRRPALEPYAALTLPAADAASPIRVRFAGVSTLLFDDGETAFMTDGFFSRPGIGATFTSKIGPDAAAVDAGLARLGVHKLAGVVVMHSHYDHALDAPMVAQKTGAVLIGGASALNVGRGAGLAEGMMRKVVAGDAVELGKWRLTFIPSRHAPTPYSSGAGGEDIEQPLVPPARATAWREGETWSLLVAHQSGASYLVQGSAGFQEGALKGRKADVVFLGIGAAGKQTSEYRAALWREVVRALGARRVIAIHWDDFWLPGDQPLQPMALLFDDLAATMQDLQRLAQEDRIELRMPPQTLPFAPTP